MDGEIILVVLAIDVEDVGSIGGGMYVVMAAPGYGSPFGGSGFDK